MSCATRSTIGAKTVSPPRCSVSAIQGELFRVSPSAARRSIWASMSSFTSSECSALMQPGTTRKPEDTRRFSLLLDPSRSAEQLGMLQAMIMSNAGMEH